jgi:hypothetical protein
MSKNLTKEEFGFPEENIKLKRPSEHPAQWKKWTHICMSVGNSRHQGQKKYSKCFQRVKKKKKKPVDFSTATQSEKTMDHS